MKLSKCWFGALAIAATVVLFNSSARADSYQVYDLGDANGFAVYGIDTSGAVVISDNLAGPTYNTWVNGAIINTSLTVPVLAYDNGTPCSPVLSPGITLIPGTKASCNNGREVYGGEYLGINRGVYTGPDPTDFLQSGTVDGLVLNSSGDFAWTDGRDEENFEAINLSTAMTPEPNSFILLGTGMFAALGTMRRRLFQ